MLFDRLRISKFSRLLTKSWLRIRKVRPSSLGNIFQIMEESPEDEEAPLEKPLPPAPLPKEQRHPFYAYASEYWLSHTSTIRKDDVHYKLWTRLVLASNALAPKPWTWKSRAWSEPEDPDLLQAIVELNHGALLGVSLLSSHVTLPPLLLSVPPPYFSSFPNPQNKPTKTLSPHQTS